MKDQTASQTVSGCSCGCGGHDAGTSQQQVPISAVRLEEGDPAAFSGDPGAIAAVVAGILGGEPAAREQGGGATSGVVPGHKAGNLLGLRDVSASASGGCGCGGHGSH